MPAVPTVVFIHAVLVLMTIGQVVLLVVGDEVVQSETIVGGHIVHALIGVISIGAGVRKEVVAAIDTPHHVGHHSRIAFDETANIVAKSSVPLEPGDAWEPPAKLIGACVPRFRDQTQPAQLRVSGNFTEEWSVPPVQ